MVVVQTTAFCNIDCGYCYLPDRNNKHVITVDTVERLFREIFATGWAARELTVVWHAGEPLVAPLAFYREAFALIERLRPSQLAVKHSFQTNGTLIDDAWCGFFREWNAGVGVSIDGPRELHDRNRKTRSGAGTFDRTIAGIRRLRANDVPFHVISVLSRDSLAMPDEMLAFYLEEGIGQVCFNVEESEGDHVSSLFADSEDGGPDLRRRYAAFLRRFWHGARASGRIDFVREIDLALPRVFRPAGLPERNIQTEPLAMLNVDSRGNVSSYSPELLGLKSTEYGDYILGNIVTDSLADIYARCANSALHRDIQLGVKACARSCEYFSVCGGGAPINKLSENGSFASGRTAYCELTQMVPTDLILEAYDRLEQSWSQPPSTAVPADSLSELPSRMP